jgi:tetratricopeptide (TPR) repeat protein
VADYSLAIELKHEPLNWPYFNRGNAYADQQLYEQAIADYNQALTLDDKDVNAYYQRGLAYRQIEDTEKAIADFKKVSEIGNDFWRQEVEEQLKELGVE